MSGAMKFKVQTDDDVGRLVKHHAVFGSKDGAVKSVLRRRYRLRENAVISLNYRYGHATPGYGRGTFEVFLGSFARPAHRGWFMVQEVE